MIPGEPLTVWTVRLSMVFFAAALLCQPTAPNRQRLVRALWTVGFLWMLVHVGCAFHFFHGWSHRAALADTARKTAEQIGWSFAGGLYFNYVFVALWGCDVLWWWIAPATYLRRPVAWAAGIYGFLLFIAVQATIVFEAGPTRWAATIVLLLIVVRFAGIGREREV